jgi:hypothetical protein
VGIAEWALVVNAVVAVLMVGYGVWLKHFMKQQLADKDSVIESLKAVATSKDTEISKLKGDVAPAVTQSLAWMTADTIRLWNLVNNFSEPPERAAVVAPALEWLARAKGVIFCSELLKSNLAFAESGKTTEEQYVNACATTLKDYDAEIVRLRSETNGLVEKLKKRFPED